MSGMPPTLVTTSGFAGGGGFQHDIGEGFRARRHHHDAAECEGAACGQRRDEADGIVEADASCLFLQVRRAALPCADDGRGESLFRRRAEPREHRSGDRHPSDAAIRRYREGRWRRPATAPPRIRCPQTPFGTIARERLRCADLFAVKTRDEGAFEQEQIGAPLQQLLQHQVKRADRGAGPEQQAAAMRRVDPQRSAAADRKPRIGRAFGAVAMHARPVRFRRRASRRDGLRTRPSIPIWRGIAMRDNPSASAGAVSFRIRVA